ncbi:MAG TPA: hypothetical protein VD968_11215 [Pyrinomonadaceae bacterium]|nr:hypothetical protein [Pyrinomonadaceae bacterium]
MSEEMPQTLEVPLAALAELAVECWRLERWAETTRDEASAARARHAARRLAKFLGERGVSFVDLTGRAYEPGLAVEVLDVIRDPGAAGDTIDETVSPVVLWRGSVISHGQVVIRKK